MSLARAIAFAAAVAASLAGSARADTVTLNDGRRIEGAIEREGPERVDIRTRTGGVVSIPRDEIERVERAAAADPKDEFAERRAVLERERRADAPAWFRLGAFAADHGLAAEARLAFEKCVGIDPNHAAAWAALGYERWQGAWLPRAEIARRKGLVEHEGRFVTLETKEKLEQGLVRIAGEWVSKDTLARRDAEAAARREASRRAAQERAAAQPAVDRAVEIARQKADARAVERKLGLVFTDLEEGPLLVHTTCAKDSEKLGELVRALSRIYAAEMKTYDLAADSPLWPGKLQVFFFEEKEDFDRFAVECDDAPGAVQSGGYFIETWDQGAPRESGGSGEARARLHIALYRLEPGTLAHELSHAFMSRYGASERRVSPWANEGVAEYLRAAVAGSLEGGARGTRHRGLVKEMLLRGDERASLRAIMAKRQIAAGEAWAYAVAYSLVDFMIAADRTKFVKFLKTLKAPDGPNRWDAADAAGQARAIEQAYGVPVETFEASWKDYVRNSD